MNVGVLGGKQSFVSVCVPVCMVVYLTTLLNVRAGQSIQLPVPFVLADRKKSQFKKNENRCL